MRVHKDKILCDFNLAQIELQRIEQEIAKARQMASEKKEADREQINSMNERLSLLN